MSLGMMISKYRVIAKELDRVYREIYDKYGLDGVNELDEEVYISYDIDNNNRISNYN